jgi:hypothetical protein
MKELIYYDSRGGGGPPKSNVPPALRDIETSIPPETQTGHEDATEKAPPTSDAPKTKTVRRTTDDYGRTILIIEEST